MSRQRIHYFDDWSLRRKHQDKLARKYEKIQTLKALLEMWEPNPDAHDYVLTLRAKLCQAQNQLEAMQP